MSLLARAFFAVPAIAAGNALLFASCERVYSNIVDNASSGADLLWFRLYFVTTFIVIFLCLIPLAPVIYWLGKKFEGLQLKWLLPVGIILGPTFYILRFGMDALNLKAILICSALGGFSAILWWGLIERYRITMTRSEVDQDLEASPSFSGAQDQKRVARVVSREKD